MSGVISPIRALIKACKLELTLTNQRYITSIFATVFDTIQLFVEKNILMLPYANFAVMCVGDQ